MIKLNHTKKWFTIVELIVVITILAILWTIWFVSYVSHISTSRDATRISQIQIINQALEWYWKWKIPLPDDNVIVYANWVIIWYQWYAWKNVLSDIWINNWGKDPSDNSYYTYFTDKKQKYAQILTFLEKSDSWEVSYNRFITKTNAADNSEKYPMPYWAKLWVMVQSWTNIPIQSIEIIMSKGIDVVTTTWSYIAYFTKDKYISWSWGILQFLQQSIMYWWVWFWAPRTCPEWFLKVPWNIDFNQPGFCVMKYEATYEDATVPNAWWNRNSVNYFGWKKITSKPWLYPIGNISQANAITTCKSMWEWYHLITNNERMTIARDIESQWANWNTNVVWSGSMYVWLTNIPSDSTSLWCAGSNSLWKYTSWLWVAAPLNADTTKWWPNKLDDCDSKRQHILSNWEIIWDISWNMRDQVNWWNTLDWSNNTVPWKTCWWTDWRFEFNTVNICSFASPYSLANQWPKTSGLYSNNGVWVVYSISTAYRGLIRWSSDNNDTNLAKWGVYTLFGRDPGLFHDVVGFRCAK